MWWIKRMWRRDGLNEYYVVDKEGVEKGQAEGVLGGG